ncbi:tripartite tricarboxylate transporter substrate binding protein [uncultured Pigmentiphaga sp.]|jgi:Uncharacterized protein conserved in bacteria|uniref:Bug family tripartite tricarboxylate transporter substrate binding protein n=1 Tax=uncultured Pigmentiphaga sp. TaxID=340361 RepID=UPI00260BD35B|nr:tripartite tricarboxylate transporter substrate binding protein [uncultured Pigmentiphaga sp.]
MNFLKAIAAFALVAASPITAAQADSYPSQPIRLVVPYAAGGTSDLIARLLAEPMAAALKVPLVVENRAGAGGNIGTEQVARAKADGYTLLMGVVATHGINPSLYKKTGYDPVKDFEPVTLIASTPSVVLVNPKLPVQSIQDLIAMAKSSPGKINFGSSGNGSSHHLAGELFKSMARVEMLHIPYRGTAAAQVDLIAGEIQVLFDTLPSAMPHIKAGKVRPLAVTSATRDPSLPDLPTVAEAGLPGYEVGSWYGLLFPAGTPKEIVSRVNAIVVDIVQSPAIRQQLLSYGATPIASTPEAFAAHINSELKKWAAVIRTAGASVD